jgi:hypothetical protein
LSRDEVWTPPLIPKSNPVCADDCIQVIDSAQIAAVLQVPEINRLRFLRAWINLARFIFIWFLVKKENLIKNSFANKDINKFPSKRNF